MLCQICHQDYVEQFTIERLLQYVADALSRIESWNQLLFT